MTEGAPAPTATGRPTLYVCHGDDAGPRIHPCRRVQEALRDKGATAQRCLWASTSTKNPDYRDVIYVEELVGPDTVNTMPRATVEAVDDHGEIRDSLEEDVDGARKVLDDLEAAGIDYDDVVDTLEKEGVQKFADSFDELLEGVAAKRAQLVAA